MLDLSPETEAWARRLGEARGSSVDATIREALETLERDARKTGPRASQRAEMRDRQVGKRDMSPEAIARRQASLERIQREIAALPDLDPRTSEEIMDDLDPL